jgi:hypothetical protein
MLTGQGSAAQNRAVEGDEVALQVLPPSQWFISASQLEAARSGSPATAGVGNAAQPASAAVGVSALADEPLDAEAALLPVPGCAADEALPEMDDDLACDADAAVNGGGLPDQAQPTVDGEPSSEGTAAEQAARRRVEERERKVTKRSLLAPDKAPNLDLVGATRAQLEAQFGNGGGAPWDRAGTPQETLAIIAAL